MINNKEVNDMSNMVREELGYHIDQALHETAADAAGQIAEKAATEYDELMAEHQETIANIREFYEVIKAKNDPNLMAEFNKRFASFMYNIGNENKNKE